MKMVALPGKFQMTNFRFFYYYNGDDIDFKRKLNRLNIIANKFEISKKGWKLPFRMKNLLLKNGAMIFKKRLSLL